MHSSGRSHKSSLCPRPLRPGTSCSCGDRTIQLWFRFYKSPQEQRCGGLEKATLANYPKGEVAIFESFLFGVYQPLIGNDKSA